MPYLPTEMWLTYQKNLMEAKKEKQFMKVNAYKERMSTSHTIKFVSL